MKRKEFLKELEKGLHGLPKEEIEEVVEDYEEHFKIGKKNKRKESEIAKSLGDPKKLAKEVKKELGQKDSLGEDIGRAWVSFRNLIKNFFVSIEETVKGEFPEAKKTMNEGVKTFKKTIKKSLKTKKRMRRGIGGMIGLIFLNLVLVIPVWVSFLGAIISLIAASWSIVASGLAAILSILFVIATQSSENLANLLWSGFFGSLGLTALGFIFSILTWSLGKQYFKLSKWYLKWNHKIFTGGKK